MTKLPSISRARRHKGFSLIVTLMLMAVLAASIGVLFKVVLSSGRTTGEMLQRRKSFYACDGMGRVVTKLAQDYLASAESPNDTDLVAHVCAEGGGTCPQLPTITPSGYNVTDFTVALGNSTTAPIPSGPFRDMNARQTDLEMDLRAEQTNTGLACETHQDYTLAQIGLFQFFVFGEGLVDIYNPAPITVTGRIHVNGDFCASAGSGSLKLDVITAAGKILVGSGCPRYMWASGGEADIKVLGTASTYRVMNAANDHTCTTCGATAWADYATARWSGGVADEDHRVPFLKLPIGGNPSVQDGLNASGGTEDNSTTQRFIIDPVRPSDTSDVKEQRFAHKADIRIVNGVWYKRDTGNPSNWPGIPIWSDHPGHYRTIGNLEENLVSGDGHSSGERVGQRDIYIDQSYTQVPKRYSYYEYDSANARLFENHQGVISYGVLNRVSSTNWRPGFFIHDSNASNVRTTDDPNESGAANGNHKYRFCAFNADGSLYSEGGRSTLRPADTHTCRACVSTTPTDDDCNDGGGVDTVVTLDKGANYIEGTRSGFADPRLAYDIPSNGHTNASRARGKVLPVNFNVEEFAAAMSDTTSGELGSHFNGGLDFNGIIYVTYTWDNQLAPGSFGVAGNQPLPTMPPNPNDITVNTDDDPTQARSLTDHSSTAGQNQSSGHLADSTVTRSLPWPLCSGTNGTIGGFGYVRGHNRIAASGPAESADPGFDPLFTVPNCSPSVNRYPDPAGAVVNPPSLSPTTRPNALRVHNGYTISKTVFPKGLTIATNMPAYVLGDYNKRSDDVPGDWVPALVAADSVTFLSKTWSDINSHWEMNGELAQRDADDTHYHLAILAGDVTTSASAWGGGFHNFMRFAESWSGETATLYGSLVIGFRSVYARQPWVLAPVYAAPNRDFNFDTNFGVITNQPPGAPVYNVQALKRWSAE